MFARVAEFCRPTRIAWLGLCGAEIVMASGGDVCACCGSLWHGGANRLVIVSRSAEVFGPSGVACPSGVA